MLSFILYDSFVSIVINCSSNIFTKYLYKFPKNEISIIVADIIALSLSLIFKICYNSNIVRFFKFIFR